MKAGSKWRDLKKPCELWKKRIFRKKSYMNFFLFKKTLLYQIIWNGYIFFFTGTEAVSKHDDKENRKVVNFSWMAINFFISSRFTSGSATATKLGLNVKFNGGEKIYKKKTSYSRIWRRGMGSLKSKKASRYKNFENLCNLLAGELNFFILLRQSSKWSRSWPTFK